MVKENAYIKGWRSFKFYYGNMSVEVEARRDSALEADLHHHIEELAYGGWRESLPTLDETESH